MSATTLAAPSERLQRLLHRPLLVAAGFSFALNLLLLAPAVFMLQVFDRVLLSRSQETLTVLLVGVAVALTMLLLLDHLRARLQGVSGQLLGDALLPLVSSKLLVRLARRSERESTTSALRDVQSLRALFSAQGLLALLDAPWLLVYVAVIALAHPWLGVAAAVASAAMLALTILNDRMTRRDIESLQRAAGRAQRWLEHTMSNAEVAQALGMGDSLLARWRRLNAQAAELHRPTAGRSVAFAAAARTLRQVVQVGMLALGAWLVIRQEASPGVMVATTILLGRALAPVEQLVGSWRVLAEGRAAWGRLQKLLDETDATDDTARMALPAPQGQLRAQQLIYRAPGGERLLLAGISLELAPGEALAVVGPSGAGKSTLARLLVGLWRPTTGVVRLDGVDLAQWPRAGIGPFIGYVPQSVELFAGTVAENIARMGDVDGAAVVRAAKRAHIHEMVLALPEGYDTPVDPNSALISPGQRQRIALARALYGEPKLLILDEPNANLDGSGELALAEALDELRGKVTVVVVTHRTNLVQHVDRMLVLEGGRAQLYGPVAEVMAKLQQENKRGAAAGAQGHVVAISRGVRPAEGAA